MRVTKRREHAGVTFATICTDDEPPIVVEAKGLTATISVTGSGSMEQYVVEVEGNKVDLPFPADPQSAYQCACDALLAASRAPDTDLWKGLLDYLEEI